MRRYPNNHARHRAEYPDACPCTSKRVCDECDFSEDGPDIRPRSGFFRDLFLVMWGLVCFLAFVLYSLVGFTFDKLRKKL